MSEIWMIIATAIAISVFRRFLRQGGVPRPPDSPQGFPQEDPQQGRAGQSMSSRRPAGETGTPQQYEIQGKSEGHSEYGRKQPVTPTLQEPHETVATSLREPSATVKESVQVSTSAVEAPVYRNEKRRKPDSDAERAFSGQSAYDRIGSHPVGRTGRRKAPFSLEKEDLMRAIVMAEVLGPPRAKQKRKKYYSYKDVR